MRRERNSKIIATLGPSSNTSDKIAQLVEAGADIFRINMSHTSHELLTELHKAIRDVETNLGHPIGILADMQGPKLRVGRLKGGSAELQTGSEFTLDLEDTPGDASRVHIPHEEIFKAAQSGAKLLLDDGRIRLRVSEVKKGKIHTKVVSGGTLSDRKGLNVPDLILPISPLTGKDRADLAAALDIGVDWVALSFVQKPDDLAEARTLIQGRAALLAKIEKPAAVKTLDAIVGEADAVMVARGDLGVEMPLDTVPGIQKQITRAARAAGKPCVVATQMLESMITSPIPTRAEVSDVANAVFEGADAIMLSAESAAGSYPVEAVATMDRIARTAERDPTYRSFIDAQRTDPEPTTADAITAAAHQVAHTLRAAAIVCYTTTGSTAMRASRERPDTPVLVLTPSQDTARRLAIGWGLTCALTEDAHNLDDMVARACRVAFQQRLAAPGNRIVITAGMPFGTPGATNLLRIAMVGSEQRSVQREISTK